jgi:hypothetical protein
VIYTPNDQSPSTFLTYMVRTVGDPATAIGSVREALRAMDPLLPMIRPQTLEASPRNRQRCSGAAIHRI